MSTAAPYRHFADRDALLSAVAAVGYRDLAARLAAAHPAPITAEDLAAIAIAYVQFALTRPGLFRVMFAEPCDPTSPNVWQRPPRSTNTSNRLCGRRFPRGRPGCDGQRRLGTGARPRFLHLDGKFDVISAEAVADRIRAAVYALLGASSQGPTRPSPA
ncbi:WHG domain-containing protein [Nocardia amikacinitolerans]|nr:WHG domain-containing protein [Nocardia amikacinitolerans]